MKSGVYKIEHKPSGRVYIGSSRDVFSRIKKHKEALHYGRHTNKHLLNAFTKYGENSFLYDVVSLCSKDDLLTEEQNMIDHFRSWEPAFGFNIRKKAFKARGSVNSCPVKTKYKSGDRFGRLTMIKLNNIKVCQSSKSYLWLCKCDCGNEIIADRGNLVRGTTTSCGCFNLEQIRKSNTKHGMASRGNVSRENRIWSGMKSRCTNPNVAAYGRYGGAGKSFCERWNKFENFFADMGPCPEGLTLERKDNTKGYSPENCIWADYLTQGRNTKRVRMVNVGDETLPWTAAVKKIGFCQKTFLNIRKNKNFSDQDIIDNLMQRKNA